MKKIDYCSALASLYYEKLDNGLEIYMFPKNDFASCYVALGAKLGSFNEGDIVTYKDKEYRVEKGMAHFIEHRIFDYEGEDIFDVLSRKSQGANAFTTYKYTCYHLELVKNLKFNLNLLLDFTQKFEMDPLNVEREKKIILQEYYESIDDPSSNIYFDLLKNTLIEHPLKSHILGDKEAIEGVSYEHLKVIHDAYYHPSNLTLLLVGKFNPETVIKIVKENQAKKTFEDYKITKKKHLEPSIVKLTNEEKKISKDYNLVNYAYKLPKVDLTKHSLSYYKALFNLFDYALGNSSSKLSLELIKNDVISDELGFYRLFDEDINILFIDSSSLLNKEKFEEILSEFILHPLDYLIDEETFELAKRAFISKSITNLNKISKFAYRYLSLKMADIDYYEYLEALKKISYADIKEECLKLLDSSISRYYYLKRS